MKPTLEYLESIIVRPCNLSCQGCTTFSDLKWQGYTTWAEGLEQIKPWTERLDIQAWGAMGGEPLMNPDLENWLRGIRNLLPNTQIRFVTNGTLLPKNMWVVSLLEELGNSTLKISYHLEDQDVDRVINDIMEMYPWQPVNEYGIDRWLTKNNFRFQIARPKKFLKTFRGTYDDMHPHNSNPVDSFNLCVQQRCPLLFEGRLYKCGTAGLTPDLLRRFKYPNQSSWEPYMNTGLSVDCLDSDLEKFVNNFGRPNSICRQCPGPDDVDSFVDHSITVIRK